MKRIEWSSEKNEILKKTRNISFEEILQNGTFLDDIPHPSREKQRIKIYDYNGYPYLMPYVEDDEKIFLKTAFPNRDYKNLL
uniref:Ribonuclease toxin n=1 Tax=virus sp. ctkyY8 TaxID=2827995 RepID=A0A8S5REY6_9VIRU|nr:MAG TPA: ribonuclease toxin [virus sp. ctkyY8]